MCGIAGFIDPGIPPQEHKAAVERMCAVMRHRGPDDSGVAPLPDGSMGSCRLAIFDPARGHQPMVSPDNRWTLVFNGAIYNFREVRAELASGGWAFRTSCDTEVLLAAYARWGEKCLSRLRGMFAFAVWDAQERSLFLARDPFGIKPLYFKHTGDRLLFASELNALFASRHATPDIDPAAVSDYLAWLAVPAPRTIYRDVLTLRPGEAALFRGGRLTVRPTWNVREIPEPHACGTHEEFIRELRRRLEDTIAAHMLADVPVGAFLSGGLDSAAIVGLMTRASGTPLRTFCIGFEEAEYTEAAKAELVARHFGATHQTYVLTGREVAGDIETLLGSLDQPTGDGVNTYYASKVARAGGVTVALSGLGGDELFGGYPSFHDTPKLARWLPLWAGLPGFVRQRCLRMLRKGDTRQRKIADVLEYARNINDVASLQRRVFSEVGRRTLLSRDAVSSIGCFDPLHPSHSVLSAELDGATSCEIVSAWELRTYMADVLLRDSDVMSMRHSLELRVPFVDRSLIEWIWRQPRRSPTRRKASLHEAVADLVPAELAKRPKRGFTLPFANWMKHELRPFLEATFDSGNISRSGLFETDAVRSLWQGFLGRNDTREWSRVWSLAVLIDFANRRAPAFRPTPETRPVPIACTGVAAPGRRRNTLLLAPEIYASEGGIPRILQLYVKAVCETKSPGSSVRLIALNDRASDGVLARARLDDSLDEWHAAARSKARFVRESIRLSRDTQTMICGHIRQLPIAWAARKLNPDLRYYLVAHGIEVWRPFTRLERAALQGAERILCVSDYTRRELLKNCELPAERTVVLHNALDPFFEIEPGHPLAGCDPVILIVTRLTYVDRYKGVQHMIEAMPAIRSAIPNATMRIIGRGDDLPRLRRIRDDLGMRAAIDFPGYVDDATLAAEMRRCRLFALPSRKEGFGLVFLEAMAHGRPCLGARAGGIPEVITPDTGVLVEYGDVAAIASAAVSALTRQWDVQAILARAREFSFAHFKSRLNELLAG